MVMEIIHGRAFITVKVFYIRLMILNCIKQRKFMSSFNDNTKGFILIE